MPKIFTIQEHNASHHHYTPKLEIDGVLKSFALLKTPPTAPTIKRLAIKTKHHPLKHTDFNTKKPKNNPAQEH